MPKSAKVTIIPAKTMPNKIKIEARNFGIQKRNAAKAPVQAPVIGKGIPTNITKASEPRVTYLPLNLLRVLLKSQLKNLFHVSHRLKKLETFSKKSKIKITGKKFPATENKNAFQSGKWKTSKASGSPARSSPIGTIETKKVASSGGKFLNNSKSQFIS